MRGFVRTLGLKPKVLFIGFAIAGFEGQALTHRLSQG